jgi:hypothetical protein
MPNHVRTQLRTFGIAVGVCSAEVCHDWKWLICAVELAVLSGMDNGNTVSMN